MLASSSTNETSGIPLDCASCVLDHAGRQVDAGDPAGRADARRQPTGRLAVAAPDVEDRRARRAARARPSRRCRTRRCAVELGGVADPPIPDDIVPKLLLIHVRRRYSGIESAIAAGIRRRCRSGRRGARAEGSIGAAPHRHLARGAIGGEHGPGRGAGSPARDGSRRSSCSRSWRQDAAPEGAPPAQAVRTRGPRASARTRSSRSRARTRSASPRSRSRIARSRCTTPRRPGAPRASRPRRTCRPTRSHRRSSRGCRRFPPAWTSRSRSRRSATSPSRLTDRSRS